MSTTVRVTEQPISALFTDRWSPRSLTSETISDAELLRLLEAARWAPSAFNNQPWRFVYVLRDSPEWAAVHGALIEFNQMWTAHAAALVVVLSKETLVSPQTGAFQANPSHAFDAGAAWMSVALEATASGWSTHAMTGLDFARMREAIGASEGFAIDAAFAVGRRGPADVLPDMLKAREAPSPRKPLAAIAAAGRFQFSE